MTITHNLGIARTGVRRELQDGAAQLRQRHWQQQSGLDLAPVGDFSPCDHVLDMSFTLGNAPERIRGQGGEMSQWFDTSYRYTVPGFDAGTRFTLDTARLQEQLAQARALGVKAKPVIIGPLTYLWLGKARDGSERLDLLPHLLPVYAELLAFFLDQGVEWVQVDEPLLVTELDARWRAAYEHAYAALAASGVKLLLATYFGALKDNLPLACALPVDGLHLDAINARFEIAPAVAALGPDKVLSLGVIDGRNVWKTDLHATLEWLEPVQRRIGPRLWIAPSCSLLHVPVDLASEETLDPEIRSWLAFALQKLEELRILARALDNGRSQVQAELVENAAAVDRRDASPRVRDPDVARALAAITSDPDCGLATRSRDQLQPALRAAA